MNEKNSKIRRHTCQLDSRVRETVLLQTVEALNTSHNSKSRWQRHLRRICQQHDFPSTLRVRTNFAQSTFRKVDSGIFTKQLNARGTVTHHA